MTIYLTENCVGSDPKVVAFPGLILCMGFVAQMKDGSLVGAHIADASEEEYVLSEMKSQIEGHESSPARYYMATNFKNHFGADRKLSFTAKARKVGCSVGNIHIVDTASVVNAGSHGHFVRFVSNNGDSACQIYVLDNDNVKCSGLIMRSKIDENSSIKYATSDTPSLPNFIFSSDNMPKDSQPVDPKSIKTAHCY